MSRSLAYAFQAEVVTVAVVKIELETRHDTACFSNSVFRGNRHEVETSLGYIARPCLKCKKI